MDKQFFDNMKGQMIPSEKVITELRSKIAADKPKVPRLSEAARNVIALAACFAVIATGVVALLLTKPGFINSRETSPASAGITREEAETLLQKRYRFDSVYNGGAGVDFDSPSVEQYYTTYYRNSEFPTWESWVDFVHSVYTDDYAELILRKYEYKETVYTDDSGNTVEKTGEGTGNGRLIEHDGLLYSNGGISDTRLPSDWSYYIKENGENSAVIAQIYKSPYADRIVFDEFKTIYENGVWKIDEFLPKYGDEYGNTIVDFGGRKWYISDILGGKAKLFAQEAITVTGNPLEYLNGEFYDGFTDEEKRVLVEFNPNGELSSTFPVKVYYFLETWRPDRQIVPEIWIRTTSAYELPEITRDVIESLIDEPEYGYYIEHSEPGYAVIAKFNALAYDEKTLWYNEIVFEFKGGEWGIMSDYPQAFSEGDVYGNCIMLGGYKWHLLYMAGGKEACLINAYAVKTLGFNDAWDYLHNGEFMSAFTPEEASIITRAEMPSAKEVIYYLGNGVYELNGEIISDEFNDKRIVGSIEQGREGAVNWWLDNSKIGVVNGYVSADGEIIPEVYDDAELGVRPVIFINLAAVTNNEPIPDNTNPYIDPNGTTDRFAVIGEWDYAKSDEENFHDVYKPLMYEIMEAFKNKDTEFLCHWFSASENAFDFLDGLEFEEFNYTTAVKDWDYVYETAPDGEKRLSEIVWYYKIKVKNGKDDIFTKGGEDWELHLGQGLQFTPTGKKLDKAYDHYYYVDAENACYQFSKTLDVFEDMSDFNLTKADKPDEMYYQNLLLLLYYCGERLPNTGDGLTMRADKFAEACKRRFGIDVDKEFIENNSVISYPPSDSYSWLLCADIADSGNGSTVINYYADAAYFQIASTMRYNYSYDENGGIIFDSVEHLYSSGFPVAALQY